MSHARALNGRPCCLLPTTSKLNLKNRTNLTIRDGLMIPRTVPDIFPSPPRLRLERCPHEVKQFGPKKLSLFLRSLGRMPLYR